MCRSTKEKLFLASSNRVKREIIYSCHLFEFQRIVCRHAIIVLTRNYMTVMLDFYIMRRWRRDISRAHMRLTINYDALVSSPGQLSMTTGVRHSPGWQTLQRMMRAVSCYHGLDRTSK